MTFQTKKLSKCTKYSLFSPCVKGMLAHFVATFIFCIFCLMPVFDKCTEVLVVPSCKASQVSHVFWLLLNTTAVVYFDQHYGAEHSKAGPNIVFHIFLRQKRGLLTWPNEDDRMKSVNVTKNCQRHFLPHFSCFFLLFTFFIKKCERVHFDQPHECAAPKYWSKYTTYCKIKIKWKSFVFFLC